MRAPVVSEAASVEIPSLLVPMTNGKLLLPTVSVAEMITYQPPKEHQPTVTGEIPQWYLGNLAWRGVMVPMVSYEGLSGEEVPAICAESQILILNNTGVNAQLPFLCMPTQGIPRLSRIAANEISEIAEGFLKHYDFMQVFVAGEQATIPDVSKLEQACVDLLGL